METVKTRTFWETTEESQQTSAHLCGLVTLQGHADVQVAVSETETVFGRAEQAELSFFCGTFTVSWSFMNTERREGESRLTVVLLPDEPLQAGQDLLPLLLLHERRRQLICKQITSQTFKSSTGHVTFPVKTQRERFLLEAFHKTVDAS